MRALDTIMAMAPKPKVRPAIKASTSKTAVARRLWTARPTRRITVTAIGPTKGTAAPAPTIACSRGESCPQLLSPIIPTRKRRGAVTNRISAFIAIVLATGQVLTQIVGTDVCGSKVKGQDQRESQNRWPEGQTHCHNHGTVGDAGTDIHEHQGGFNARH